MKNARLILASELTASLPVIERELSGRTGRLMFVPTAAYGEGWEPAYETHVRPFEAMGFEVETVDLRGRSGYDVRSALERADVVYVCGGNTFFLLEHMRASEFDSALPSFLTGGGVYIGSSAGAIVVTPDIGYADLLDSREGSFLEDDRGLGLVDFSILPHLNHPDYGEAVRNAFAMLSAESAIPCIGLDDGQVLVVEGRGVRVVS